MVELLSAALINTILRSLVAGAHFSNCVSRIPPHNTYRWRFELQHRAHIVIMIALDNILVICESKATHFIGDVWSLQAKGVFALRSKCEPLAVERRKLLMIELSKPYSFDSILEGGDEVTKTLTLSDLFNDRRQVIVYHFLFDLAWDEGCMKCIVMGDSFPAALEHIYSRSTTVVAVSRARIDKMAAYKNRMDWSFPWVSSYDSDFNYDMYVTQDDTVQPIEYSFRNR
ncbi:hypothetical protein BJX65DRAFT_312481 [Aspergillus insuetus]